MWEASGTAFGTGRVRVPLSRASLQQPRCNSSAGSCSGSNSSSLWERLPLVWVASGQTGWTCHGFFEKCLFIKPILFPLIPVNDCEFLLMCCVVLSSHLERDSWEHQGSWLKGVCLLWNAGSCDPAVGARLPGASLALCCQSQTFPGMSRCCSCWDW